MSNPSLHKEESSEERRPTPPPKDGNSTSNIPANSTEGELEAFLTVPVSDNTAVQPPPVKTSTFKSSASSTSNSSGSSLLNPMKAVSSATSFISRLTLSSKDNKDKDKDNETTTLKFQPHPSWNYSVYTAIAGLRNIVAIGKDSVDTARQITTMQFARVPTPLHVKLTKVKVPRRPGW